MNNKKNNTNNNTNNKITPIITYIDLDKNKYTIYENSRNKSAIYRWNNLITGRSYVGSAVNLIQRLWNYFSPSFLKKELLKHRSIISSSLLKHGYSNFNTPKTMTPLFPSREPSIHKNNTLTRTSGSYVKPNLKFEDLTISHPINRNIDSTDWSDKRFQVQKRFKEGMAGYSDKVVVNETQIEKRGLLGKIKLGFKSFTDAFNKDTGKTSTYIKYHDIAKRKFMWVIWEGDRGDYESYKDLKKSFDPKTKIFNKIWTTIKSDLSSEIKGLIKAKDPFRLDSTSPLYRNMRLDPAKKADYFAYLSENKPTKNNTTSYKEDLIK